MNLFKEHREHGSNCSSCMINIGRKKGKNKPTDIYIKRIGH